MIGEWDGQSGMIIRKNPVRQRKGWKIQTGSGNGWSDIKFSSGSDFYRTQYFKTKPAAQSELNALARIHGLVKPGGLFISKTICLSGEGVPFKVKLIKLVLPIARAVGFAPAVRFFTVDQMDAWVRDAGFDILEAGNFPASPPRRYLVARKR